MSNKLHVSHPDQYEDPVLGSGAGGKMLSWHLARSGRRVAVIERRYNEWQEIHDGRSAATTLGIHWLDVPIAASQRAPIRFTFYWPGDQRWEGRDYAIDIRPNLAVDVRRCVAGHSDCHKSAATHVPVAAV